MPHELQRDPLQELFEEHYQKLHRGAKLHTHKCAGCGDELVCCCQDRRQVDRKTGEERKLWCIVCWTIREAVQGMGAGDWV